MRLSVASRTVFSALRGGVTRAWAKAREVAAPVKGEKNAEHYNARVGPRLVWLYGFSTFAFLGTDWVTRQLRGKRADLYFLFAILYTTCVTVLVFALEYYGLSRLAPGSFSISEPGFLRLLSLSFTTLMNASELALVKPISDVALLISQGIVLCTFLILGLLLAVWLAPVRERYLDDMKQLVDELDALNNQVRSFVKQSYALSAAKLEEFLIQHRPIGTTLLLRMRYGADWEKGRSVSADEPPAVIEAKFEEVNDVEPSDAEVKALNAPQKPARSSPRKKPKKTK
jgi:hypothetical protein